MSAELAHEKADAHFCVALRHKVRIRLHPSTVFIAALLTRGVDIYPHSNIVKVS